MESRDYRPVGRRPPDQVVAPLPDAQRAGTGHHAPRTPTSPRRQERLRATCTGPYAHQAGTWHSVAVGRTHMSWPVPTRRAHGSHRRPEPVPPAFGRRRAPDPAAAGIVPGHAAGDHEVEDVGAVPTLRVGLGLSVLAFHAPEGDDVAVRLARTRSLADDTTGARCLSPASDRVHQSASDSVISCGPDGHARDDALDGHRPAVPGGKRQGTRRDAQGEGGAPRGGVTATAAATAAVAALFRWGSFWQGARTDCRGNPGIVRHPERETAPDHPHVNGSSPHIARRRVTGPRPCRATGQRGRGRSVLGFHAPEGDNVAVRLARAHSLSYDRRGRGGLTRGVDMIRLRNRLRVPDHMGSAAGNGHMRRRGCSAGRASAEGL